MGCSSGPDIIEDGLVLCLDAASKRSYPGTGTTCTDLKNGFTGTFQNMDATNFSGGALNFDGTNEYISFSDTGLEVGSDYSFFVWAKPNHYTSNPVILFNAGNVNDNRIFNIDIPNDKILVGHKYNNGSYWIQTGGTALNNNEWNIVGVTYGRPNMKLWLNNSVLQTGTITVSPNGPVNDRVYLGAWVGNGGYPYRGSVSRVVIYNRALSADEIRQNYLSTKERFV